MAVELNHTIVLAHDKHATATHLTSLLGLPEHTVYGPFAVVQLANGVSLDVVDDQGTPHPQHYAFLVPEAEFDAIHARIVAGGLTFWADPSHDREGEIIRKTLIPTGYYVVQGGLIADVVAVIGSTDVVMGDCDR